MTGAVSIRPAELADVAAMHALRLTVHENRLESLRRVTLDSYQSYLDQGGCALVAEGEGRIVGFGIVDTRSCSLWALFVAPDAEGAGTGRALHDALLRAAEACGCPSLSLTTAPGTRAARFYERVVWVRAGPDEDGELRFRRLLP